MNLILSLASVLKKNRYLLVSAESCTGGLFSASCTAIPGSSEWFDRGYVTYSNSAKTECLGVPTSVLERDGAVSEATALCMAQGALKHSRAQVAVSITGIAGPEGGSDDKPVGTVWFGFVLPGQSAQAYCQNFKGDREKIRIQSVEFAIRELVILLRDESETG